MWLDSASGLASLHQLIATKMAASLTTLARRYISTTLRNASASGGGAAHDGKLINWYIVLVVESLGEPMGLDTNRETGNLPFETTSILRNHKHFFVLFCFAEDVFLMR